MTGATLVIARLDRLARNVHFISGLKEAGVDFVACDNPTANRMTIYILAAVAEEEARSISIRTKLALAARKARGLPLGMNAHKRAGAVPIETSLKNLGRARAARTAQKEEAYRDYLPIVRGLRQAGKPLRAIAQELNSLGYLTRSGKPWSHVQVNRVLSLETAS
jgi:DNA invertase Pin-like site-specific DNA recombinase